LGNECNDETLAKPFKAKYPSFAMARVIRDMHTKKTKQFGFVSFMNPFDALSAMKEMQGKYVGNRPVIIRKSTWQENNSTKKRAAKKRTSKKKRVKKGFFS
jgi:RNA recognition motif-containing protein